MIFEGKSIFEITDEEISELVKEHISEKQHLEYKLTFNYKNDDKVAEFLRDVVSLANGGGGYIIIGIRDDGNGRAQKFDSDSIVNIDGILKSIKSHCQDHISERLEGLEVVSRDIENNSIIIVRVPISDRVPHMSTYKNDTGFYTRYNDGKREMTIGEIREAFKDDSSAIRLSRIENALSNISNQRSIKSKVDEYKRLKKEGFSTNITDIEDTEAFGELIFNEFTNEVDDRPYFWLSIIPSPVKNDLIDIDDTEIRNLIKNPPGSRKNGWNMQPSIHENITRDTESINLGFKDFAYLELYKNACMAFWAPLGEHFCWKQHPEEFKRRPRLWPYPVVEFPTTFLRLYSAILNEIDIDSSFILTVCYLNLKGYRLQPSINPSFRSRIYYDDKPFNEYHLKSSINIHDSDFNPDQAAYELIKRVYSKFKFPKEEIPFYNEEEKKFEFK